MANTKTNKEKLLEKYGVTGKYGNGNTSAQGKQRTSASPSQSTYSRSGESTNKEKLLKKYGVTGKYAGASGSDTTTKKNSNTKKEETTKANKDSVISTLDDNEYKTAKETANKTTTITSDLSDTDRNKRIKEIDSELKSLHTQLTGLGRAKGGSSDWYKEKEAELSGKIADLDKEKKSLERVGTFTASELKQFEIDDAKAEKAKLPTYNPTARVAPSQVEAYKANIEAHHEANEKIDTLKRQKTLYDDITDFGDVVNEDTFGGQWRANYRRNELSREADKAMSKYLDNPTEENKEIAFAYDAFEKEYAKHNEKALDDENVKASWLTKSVAGYLPQFKDQILPEAIGGVLGGLVGGAVGSSIGAGIATYGQSYNVIRGSVYRALIAEGVDEEVARKAAEDEALISSLIESGETALGWAIAGGGKALSAIGNAAKSSVAKGSTNAATKIVAGLASKATNRATTKAAQAVSRPLWKKAVRVAGGIVGNASTEYAEEFTQGAVSKANREKALATVEKEVGQFGKGNIDLYNRPIYKNEDGSISTVDSVTFKVDDKYVLLPTIARAENGKATRLNTDEEILAHYEKTGEYLGEFNNLDEANEYAIKLHSAQEYYYSNKIVSEDDGLLRGGAKVVGSALSGKNPEAFAELHGQGVEGFKIGLLFGGSQTLVNNVVAHYANAKTIDAKNKYADSIIKDEETLDALVKSGKASGTVSAKIAEEIEAAKKSGKEVTRSQVKRLIEANETYTQAEGKTTSKARMSYDALESLSKNNELITAEDVKRVTKYGDNGARVLAEAVNNSGGRSFSEVNEAMRIYYEAGLANKADVKFAPGIQQEAYLAGRQDREMSRSKATEGVFENKVFGYQESGLVTPESKNKGSLNPVAVPESVSSDMAKALDVVGKALGRKVMFVENIKVNKRGDEANAVVRGDGVFAISTTSEQPLYELVVHEPVHIMKQENTPEYHAFVDFAVQNAELLGYRLDINAGSGTMYERLANVYASRGLDIEADGIIDEIAARFAEKLVSGEQEAIDFINKMNQNVETRTALQKFVDTFKKVIAKLKELYNRLRKHGEYSAARELKKTIVDLEKGKELYEKAFKATKNAVSERAKAQSKQSEETQKNTDTNGGESKQSYSIRDEFYAEFDEWVSNGKTDTNIMFVIGNTSDALKSIGVKNQEIKLHSGTVIQKLNSHKEMTPELFKKIPELLEHPIIVQFSDAIDKTTKKPKYDSRITVLGELYAEVYEDGKKQQKPVLVSLELLPTNQKGTVVLDFSIVTSAYAKDALQNYLYENSILYIEPNKKRTDNWLSLNRLQLPLGETKYGSIRSITYIGNKVKINNPINKTAMQKALENAGLVDEYGTSSFSLKQSVEETKNLIAVHNMQVSELDRTLDLGGLPMPSIAIIKAQSGHSEYGDVSLVFSKNTIDPKRNKDNKVYGGDAWTPTYPTIEYKPNEKIAKKIREKYYEFSRKFGYDESRPLYNYVNDLERQLNNNKGETAMLEKLYNDTSVMQFYLLDSGKGKVETINKETRTELTDAEVKMHEFFIKELGADVVDEVKWDGKSNPKEYRKNYMSKYEGAIREAYKKLLIQDYKFTEEEVQNVLDSTKPSNYLNFVRDAQSYRENGRVTIKTEADYEATQKAIKEAAGEDYRKWVDSLFKGIEEKTGIRNNLSYYTNSGNARSWEALHWENNLENVVKVMKAQDDTGGGFFGGQGIWGVSAKKYRSIEEIKADTDRLKQLPEEEYQKIKDGFGDRMSEIAHSIMSKSERNPFIAADNAMECIVEAVRNSKTKSGILNNLKQYPQLTVTETTVDDIVALVSDISNMPTEYFEAKPKRAVELNEIATAVIPDNTSQTTKARLDDMGIRYVEYETGNENARLEALNSIEDVKFSLKGTNNTLGESPHSTKELLDIIGHLKSEFEVTKFAKADPKKLAKLTKDILKEYDSKVDFDETYKAVDELYRYMANGEDGNPPVWEDVYRRARKVAQEIVKNAVVVDDYAYRENKSLRDYLRTTRLKFFAEYDSVPSAYENFNEFRKLNMGRLNFTNDGAPIDSVYKELSELYPEYFNEDEQTNTADQLERIVEVLDSIRATEVNPFDGQIEQVAMHLANDLTSRFFDIPQAKPTFADKAERRVVEAKIKGGKKVESVRQQKDEKIKKLIEKQREKTKKQLDKVRQQRDTKVEKERQKRRDALSKMSESQKAKVLRARIMRHTGELSKKLLKPTDNQHIPYELQGAVATLLDCINLESNYTYDVESHSYKKNDEGLPAKRTKAFEALRKLYKDIASSVVVDPDLIGEDGLLSDVISLADKRISDMTSSELDTVWQTIRAIEASVSTANKIFSQGKFATILEYAETLRADNEGKKERTELKGVLGKTKTLATLNMLTPETYFHYLGDAGDSIFRMMRDAQDKHISIMKEVADFTHKELEGVDVNKLENTVHTVKLGGENVTLTTAQLMELYVLMKRSQAVEHIMVGGILPDVTEGKGLKLNTKAKPIRNLSSAEISAALSKLTPEQKAIADKLQKYVSTVLSAHGNEASMAVYNYEKFLEENYWTIRTNKQEINSEVGKDTAVTSVAGKGMAKGTKPHANTSVRIGSIFDTFASHSSDMATYAAWLGTSEDVNRIRNFVFWDEGSRTGTAKGILDTVHGMHGSDYLQKLLTDIAIGVKGTDNMNPFDKFIGNYKAASVGANLRVVIQQPTALLRALDMIDARYLTAGAVKPLKGWEKAKKYAPIAQWKDWGHFDINTGRQMKDILFDNASKLEKAKQVGMWGASMADSLAWGQLWNAVEAETKAKHKDIEVGSDAYYETVAKRFTEIVDHTQVVDGILQRSQIMRSPDALTKMATSFMGEPTKQYNMAVAALYDAKNGKGGAKARLGRTAISLAVSGIINACAQSIIDAMRDDDKEKDYWEKWLAAFVGDGEDNKFINSNLADTANPLNYIPFAKDVVSIVAGYDVKRMDTETIAKTYSAITNMYKAVTGTGKYTITEASAQMFAEIARISGLPVSNVKRDVKSLVMSVAIESDNYLMQYRMEKAMLDINYAWNSKNFTDILYNAYNNDREAYEIIYGDLLEEYTAGILKKGVEITEDDKESGRTAEVIAKEQAKDKIQDAMETRMKKAEGVKYSSDLSKRYMSPTDEKKYDSSLSKVKTSQVWKTATAKQRKNAEADLYDFLTSTSEDMEKTRTEAKEHGVDETEYTLYKLAIEMADQPKGEKGSGSYDYTEKAEAINSLNLGDEEIAYFFGKGLVESAKEEMYDAFEAGIGMQEYVNFKAATSEMEADKNANGNSIPNSKKRKVVDYMNNADLTDEEWEYFYYEVMGYKK